jgi:hypothetical protein
MLTAQYAAYFLLSRTKAFAPDGEYGRIHAIKFTAAWYYKDNALLYMAI